MAIQYFAGGKLVGLSSDTKPSTVINGSTFYETDTLSIYIRVGGTWTLLGLSGYSGFSGVSGFSGFSGVSGYSGDTGAAGAAGTSGYSGYSGVAGTAKLAYIFGLMGA